MPDRGLESWTEGLSARERIREIATTLTQPRSVEWVQEEARVSSWQTTKDELELFVEFDQVYAIDGDDGHPKYVPDYQVRYINEVTSLINTHTREELREEIVAIKEPIDEWKIEFGAESRDALESTLTSDDLTSEEIRERNRILRQWEHFEATKRLLKHALELYDDAHTFSPDQPDHRTPQQHAPNSPLNE